MKKRKHSSIVLNDLDMIPAAEKRDVNNKMKLLHEASGKYFNILSNITIR